VIKAEDGAVAVQALTNAAEAVDAVVLDYRLPDSNDLTLFGADAFHESFRRGYARGARGVMPQEVSRKARSTWALFK
jgi:hypothetical protein